MKVIQAKPIVTKVIAASNPESVQKSMDSSDSDQFISVLLTNEGFKAILENAKLPDELLQIMTDRLDIVPVDNGVATGIIGNWLSEQLDSFTEKQLIDISNGDNIHDIAEFVFESNIDTLRARSGYLSARYYLPLIGESKHAIVKNPRS